MIQTKGQENIFKVPKGKTRILHSERGNIFQKNEGETDFFRSTKGEKNSCLADPYYNKC